MENNQPKNNGSPPGLNQLPEIVKSPKFFIPVIIFLVAAVAGVIYLSTRRSSSGSFGPGAVYQVRLKASEKAKYGDLEIQVLRFVSDGSGDKVNFHLTQKGESKTYSNVKEGAIITFPDESGYDIEVNKTSDQQAQFSIKKR